MNHSVDDHVCLVRELDQPMVYVLEQLMARVCNGLSAPDDFHNLRLNQDNRDFARVPKQQ